MKFVHLYRTFYRGNALFLCLLMLCFSGCAGQLPGEAAPSFDTGAVTGMEETPVVDYGVPQYAPNILVNQRGYPVGEDKYAIVKGSRLPEDFRLMEAEGGTAVYTGSIEEIDYNDELALYVGRLDFGDYREEGSYYIECDIVGQSLRFSIEKGLYETIFTELLEQVYRECEERTVSLSDMIALLTVYEWYPELFAQEEGLTPGVLELMVDWIGVQEEDSTLYAAFLAKFCYLYQKFDRKYATDCLQLASSLYEKNRSVLQTDAESFFALAELYRATGLYTYRKQIYDYKDFFENNSSYMENKEYLYGAMTYMVTRQKVDVDLCSSFMDEIMSRGEEISKRYMDMIHPVAEKNNGCDDLLKCTSELACANYIMNNYQYNDIMEEFWHYLMGRNKESICFYPEQGSHSGYILLLAQLAATHRTEPET
ncbi:MAG: glycoside hydrolase family 9 protein [Roseburia sp.]|nr:glycoside hydrolase family 9 protein [Roseburia sp.]